MKMKGSGFISNMSRSADQYGNLHFISLYGAILSRLAYNNDNKFLTNYNKIFGPVVIPEILEDINKVSVNNLNQEINDQQTFNLVNAQDNTNPLTKYEYTFKNEHFIAFNELNIPENVNIITGETKGTVKDVLKGSIPPEGTVKYISIGWSSYGEIFIVADKRMPQTLFVIFRGTYSAKTAALYSKPTSLVPLTIGCGKDEGFLYGIFKPSVELIHTIIEAMSYLATDFLGATETNSVKVFTTGHSLGGAMCTNFAYLWVGIRKTAPYNAPPYNVLSNNIICVSLGAPRGMGSKVADKFCNYVKNNEILYLRITTRGDPVPGLPPKSGYQHPCSSDDTMRQVVSEDCNANLTARGTIDVKYNSPLDCQNYKTRVYAPNPLSHTIYLNILYTNAVDIVNFIKGVGIAKEVAKTSTNQTVCRIIIGTSNSYKAGFFDVSKSRKDKQTVAAENDDKKTTFGGPVSEDVYMSKEAFANLVNMINSSEPLTTDLCPMSGSIVDPFTNNSNVMPRLSCVNAPKTGGKKTKTKTKSKTKKNRKQNTKKKTYKKKKTKKN
jgi:hypothetical protein